MAAAIGIGEEGEEDKKKAKEGKCKIVFGSPEILANHKVAITKQSKDF